VPDRIALICNPNAGSAESGEALVAAARELGLDAVAFEEENSADAARRALSDGYSAVVACGGDGTVRAVADVLHRQADTIMGIVPLGTGNVVAAALGIPEDVAGALEIVAAGRTRTLDVGRCDGKAFLIGAGVGIAEAFISLTPDSQKARIGKLAYILNSFRALRHSQFDLHLELDGRTVRMRAVSVVVGNLLGTPDIRPIPDSSPSDGVLEVLVHRRLTLLQAISSIGYALKRRLDRMENVEVFRARHVRLSTHPPLAVQLDGNDPEAETPVEIECTAKSLRVMVSAEGMGDGSPSPGIEAETRTI